MFSLFLYFTLFVFVCSEGSDGGWLIVYNDGFNNCEQDDPGQVGIKFIPGCVSTERSSEMYRCDNDKNLTVYYWDSPNCQKEADSFRNLEVDVCVAYGNDSGSYQWKCMDEYSVDYKNMEFQVPFNVNSPKIGKENPFMWNEYIPVGVCVDFNNNALGKRFFIFECDESSGNGKISLFSDKKCTKSEKSWDITKGKVYNVDPWWFGGTQYIQYWYYNGCFSN